MTDKEAIANLNHIYGMVAPDIQRSLDVAIKALEERPQGEWKLVKVNLKFIYKCSECGRTIGLTHSETLLAYPFCHCGADMRGEEE